MSEHKGAIALVVAGLAMLGLWMWFNTDFMQPLIKKIGDETTATVDGIFTNMKKNEW